MRDIVEKIAREEKSKFTKVKIGQHEFEAIDKFKYLGAMINKRGHQTDIKEWARFMQISIMHLKQISFL